MQRIFGFGGQRLPPWESVKLAFPLLGTLDTPWRWERHGEAAFGRWILQQREVLRSGRLVDLTTAPPNVEFIWEPQDGSSRGEVRRTAIPAPGPGALLVITAAKQVQERRLAARMGVRLAVVEPVTMTELPKHAAVIWRATGMDAAEALLSFMAEVATGVSVSDMMARLSLLLAGRALWAASPDEEALLALVRDGHVGLAQAMAAIEAGPGRWVFRPELLEAMQAAIRAAAKQPGFPLHATAREVRDRSADGERKLPRRAVGSTLLLKGLEADRAVVFDTATMTACDLYVAISRASRSLRVVAPSPLLALS